MATLLKIMRSINVKNLGLKQTCAHFGKSWRSKRAGYTTRTDHCAKNNVMFEIAMKFLARMTAVMWTHKIGVDFLIDSGSNITYKNRLHDWQFAQKRNYVTVMIEIVKKRIKTAKKLMQARNRNQVFSLNFSASVCLKNLSFFLPVQAHYPASNSRNEIQLHSTKTGESFKPEGTKKAGGPGLGTCPLTSSPPRQLRCVRPLLWVRPACPIHATFHVNGFPWLHDTYDLSSWYILLSWFEDKGDAQKYKYPFDDIVELNEPRTSTGTFDSTQGLASGGLDLDRHFRGGAVNFVGGRGTPTTRSWRYNSTQMPGCFGLHMNSWVHTWHKTKQSNQAYYVCPPTAYITEQPTGRLPK